MSSVVRAVREHLLTCPLFTADNKGFGVDFLAEDTTAYMIEPIPSEIVIEQYVDGSAEKQLVFAFSTRESYGAGAEQNIRNLETLESFALWLEQCNIAGTLPVFDDDREARRYEVLSSGYAFHVDETKAQYRVECRLIYFEKGRLLWQ